MIKIGMMSGTKAGTAPGTTARGRTLTKCEGGYLVELGDNFSVRGIIMTEQQMSVGSEILVRITGYRRGMPLLHPLFAGFSY